MRPPKRKVQVTLTVMWGSEPWLLVTHPTGSFKVPASVSVLDIWDLAVRGVLGKPKTSPQSTMSIMVRVPLDRLTEVRNLLG